MSFEVHKITNEDWESDFVIILNESANRITSYTRTHPIIWNHNCDMPGYLAGEILMDNLATRQEALEYANMFLLLED